MDGSNPSIPSLQEREKLSNTELEDLADRLRPHAIDAEEREQTRAAEGATAEMLDELYCKVVNTGKVHDGTTDAIQQLLATAAHLQLQLAMSEPKVLYETYKGTVDDLARTHDKYGDYEVYTSFTEKYNDHTTKVALDSNSGEEVTRSFVRDSLFRNNYHVRSLAHDCYKKFGNLQKFAAGTSYSDADQIFNTKGKKSDGLSAEAEKALKEYYADCTKEGMRYRVAEQTKEEPRKIDRALRPAFHPGSNHEESVFYDSMSEDSDSEEDADRGDGKTDESGDVNMQT